MENVHVLEFDSRRRTAAVTLFQHDTGQVLDFASAFPDGVELQFDSGDARIIKNGRAEIPNVFLASAGSRAAWIQIITEDSETTIYKVAIAIIPRAPKEYVSPEDEQTFRQQIQQILDDTLAIAQSVREDADAGKFNGAPGPAGDPGKDGVSPSAKVEQTDTGAVISVTDADGTSTATVSNGKDGQPGADGEPGEKGEKGEKGDKGDPGETYDDTEIKAEIGELKEDINYLENDINPLTWIDGFMLQNEQAVAANGSRSVSNFCLCPEEAQIEYISETENKYVQGIVFYDKYKVPIIGYANNGKNGESCTVTSPKDAYYLRLSVINSDIDKAYFRSSTPIVKSFIKRNSHRTITPQDTDFAEIDVTNYMLICDIIKNKAYVVNNNTYAGLRDSDNKDSSTLCILDKTKDMYSGNRYSVIVVFFDSDRKFISSTNALYHGTKLPKEQYPSNAKYVAFTWDNKNDGVIADKMYISTVDNGWQTGLPALKYGKTIKYKGQRPVVNIYNSDTQEEIFNKLADACYTQDCDVYFEKGSYVFDIIYDKIKTYYNSAGDAFEMLLGGNCRYYMYGCIFKGDFTNSTVKCSTFGTHRHAGSYEIFGGTIICVDGIYCVHDEASAEEPLSVRKYHDVTFKYVKGDDSDYICKCLGCGTGKNTITIIDGCYFESDNDLCAAEASWHGNNNDNSACETFIEVKNSYFENKGFYVDAIPSDSEQVGKFIFCNNSVANRIPKEENGWILASWNNEIRNPS